MPFCILYSEISVLCSAKTSKLNIWKLLRMQIEPYNSSGIYCSHGCSCRCLISAQRENSVWWPREKDYIMWTSIILSIRRKRHLYLPANSESAASFTKVFKRSILGCVWFKEGAPEKAVQVLKEGQCVYLTKTRQKKPKAAYWCHKQIYCKDKCVLTRISDAAVECNYPVLPKGGIHIEITFMPKTKDHLWEF